MLTNVASCSARSIPTYALCTYLLNHHFHIYISLCFSVSVSSKIPIRFYFYVSAAQLDIFHFSTHVRTVSILPFHLLQAHCCWLVVFVFRYQKLSSFCYRVSIFIRKICCTIRRQYERQTSFVSFRLCGATISMCQQMLLISRRRSALMASFMIGIYYSFVILSLFIRLLL